MSFATIVADPPWQFGDKLPGPTRGAEKNYPCMPVEEICAYKLPELAPDARLFLWRVSSMVEEAYQVCRAWGFQPKSEIVWVKETKNGKPHFGMGRHVRAAHESCIIAVRGRPETLNRSVRSVFNAEVGRHSKKPEVFFDLVEKLSPGPYVELFARRRRPGWQCWIGPADTRIDKEIAVKLFLEENREIADEFSGDCDHAMFDPINGKYELNGDRRVKNLADAVRVCVGKGGRYFEDFDLDTLNACAPAIHNAAGRVFRVPERRQP